MREPDDDRVRVRCKGCSAAFRVPPAALGKRSKCPKCGEVFPLAAAAASPSSDPPPVPPEPVRFHCPDCSASLKVPAKAAGRRVKCSGCGAVLTVPDSAAEAGVAADVDEQQDDLFAGLAEGQDVEETASAHAASAVTTSCPHCAAAVSGGAALCASCGYNLHTGRMTGAGAASQAARGALSAAGGLAKLGGPFTRGCVCSAVGALIGAGIWFGVAYASNYEIGWIAWGVGGLAGLGMFFGHGEASPMGGLVAAGMSVMGIVVGKIMLFAVVVSPQFEIFLHEDKSSREALVYMFAEDSIELPEDTPDEMWEEVYDRGMEAALTQVRPEVAQMSDSEVEAELMERRDEYREGMRQFSRSLFFATGFAWMDLLFFALAIITAFKIGAAGVERAAE